MLKLTEMDQKLGFTGFARSCENALLVPHITAERKLRRVIDPTTKEIIYWDASACEIPADGDALKDLDIPAKHLPGRYLLGGYLRAHFGHFLVESLAPLWALDHLDGPIDGIIFFTHHNMQPGTRPVAVIEAVLKERLSALNIHTPFQLVHEPTTVDRLTVAENGLGFSERFWGSSFFTKFFRDHNVLPWQELEKRKRTKIYLTRSQIAAQKGNVIGEEALERTFEAAGYEIYAPEKYKFSEQIDKYRTVEKVVAVEGSALHLPPFSCPYHTEFGIIARRSSVEVVESDFGAQIEGFVGRPPKITHQITSFWDGQAVRGSTIRGLAVIDFEKTYRDLIEAGFLSPTDKLFYPSLQDMVDRVRAASKGRREHLHIVGLDADIERAKKELADRNAVQEARRTGSEASRRR